MNVKTGVAATVAAVLVALACGDVPGEGDSAGNNQPDDLPACAREANYLQPLARVADGQYVYDVWVELLDENCNSAAMVDRGGAPDGNIMKPLHVYVGGNITGTDGVSREADYMGGSVKEKDVDAPYHLRAFVSPRNAPHDMIVVANVNQDVREWVGESLEGGALTCRIWRDGAPIHVARGSRDRVEHTVPLVNGTAQVNCHFYVGVS